MSATTVAPPEVLAEDVLPSPRRRRRWLVVVLLLLVAGAGAGAWWFLIDHEVDDTGEVVEGAIVTLDPLTTTTGAAGIHHARVGIAIVLTEDGDAGVIPPKVPLLQDALLRAVAGRDADTLRSATGSDELRTELTAEARRIWSEEDVVRVVLTELLVQ